MITYLSMKAYVCIATKMTRLAKGANSHFFTLGYHYTFAIRLFILHMPSRHAAALAAS